MSILNRAADWAIFNRRETVEVKDIIVSEIKKEEMALGFYEKCGRVAMRRAAVHEAGHLVVCEILEPGSVCYAVVLEDSFSHGRVGYGRSLERIISFERQLLFLLFHILFYQYFQY